MIKEYDEAGYAVFAMGESRFVYDSKTGRKYWSPMCELVCMPADGAHQKITRLGVVSANGRQFFRFCEKLNTDAFIAYLKAIHSAHDKILVIADRAPSHQSKTTMEFVENHIGIEMKYFPQGSPYLNSIEVLEADEV